MGRSGSWCRCVLSHPHPHLCWVLFLLLGGKRDVASSLSLFFCVLWPHPRHTEFPRLGIQSELWPPAYTTATETWDPSHICDLHHSSRQCQISLTHWARPGIAPATSWFLVGFTNHWAMTGTPSLLFSKGKKTKQNKTKKQKQKQELLLWCNGIGGILGALGHGGDSIPSPAQWVMDPALPQLWLRLQMRLGSDPWPWNSTCHGAAKEKERKEKKGKNNGKRIKPSTIKKINNNYI